MLKSILSMSNFIAMNTSLEYGFLETTTRLRGVLRKEFEEITNMIKRKDKTSLGEAFEDYMQNWNKVNPVFVKSIRLLQTASMADEKDKENILRETTETLMLNFNTLGKRSAEELSSKAKGLIAFGVMLPVTSLMLLPLLSIFMSDFVKPGMLIFMYDILFPTIIFLAALNFANKRIQVDTIDLTESREYKKMPLWIYLVCIGVIVIFAIPGLNHLLSIDMATSPAAEREYQFMSVLSVWFILLGVVLAIYIFTSYYIRLHQRLWTDVKETEDDLPHLLQVFSTFLSLNISIENIIPSLVDDYKKQGFSDHPIVKVFSSISRSMIHSKKSIQKLIKGTLAEYCPSKKVSDILSQIISFTHISQDSAVKATKLIREQTISIYKLDDYMKTLLSETVSLINTSINMLMPLLAGVAVIMSLVIVKSLSFITEQLEAIQSSFGSKDIASLQLVDVTKVLPPTLLEVIVGFYFIEMFLVLSLFATKIKIGNDKFQFAKAINSNITGFVIFSIILLLGHYLMSELFFKGVMA